MDRGTMFRASRQLHAAVLLGFAISAVTSYEVPYAVDVVITWVKEPTTQGNLDMLQVCGKLPYRYFRDNNSRVRHPDYSIAPL